MKKIIEKNQLINYLPHKDKMFLLSRVTEFDVEKFSITVETDVTKDFIFYEEELNGIPNWCTFEIMAQAISALTGIYHSFHDIKPKAGCILSILGLKSNVKVFKLGSTVQVKAFEDYRDEKTGVYRYSCFAFTSSQTSKSAVEAIITVMQVDDIENIVNH